MNWKSQKLLCADCAWLRSVLASLIVERYTHLGDFVMRFRLSCVDNIRKFHGVLNEKDGNIVANNVPVALFSVKFDSKSANIAHSVC